MYLIDTNIISEAQSGAPPAVRWLKRADPETCFLSVLTLGEIAKGAAMKQRKDPAAGQSLARWLDQLRLGYAKRILPINQAVAMEWGHLVAIRPRPTVDALIAATAIAHRLTLVTRNDADFADIGVLVINPFAA
jgi:predicted nucleic acid-binding protein